MDISKNFAAMKYQKRRKHKQNATYKEVRNLDDEYNSLVTEIKKLRFEKKTKALEFSIKRLEQVKKLKKRKKKIAHAMSAPSTEMVREFGVPLLDTLQSVINAVKTARDQVGEDLLRFLLDLFTTLYNVYKNPEWNGVILNFSNFFLKNFNQIYADLALSWFRNAFEIVFPQADGEASYADYIHSFFKMTDSFINDRIWENMSDFLSKIVVLYAAGQDLVSIETLDFDIICHKFREFRKNLPELTDIVEMAFEAYKFVIGNWHNICTGDWSKLMLGKDETKVFELEVRELEQAYNFVLAGQEIELKNVYNITAEAYDARLKKAVQDAKKLIVRASSVQQRMSISNFVKKLTEMQSNLWARKADAPSKEEAYAIKMSGPSSCGKSTMIKLMSKTILHAYERNPSEGGNVVFTNLDEKYESTILPSHRIIVADDVANNKNSKPNYDRLLNYVNTIPRPLEKASADEKGKYYPGNDALIATTNDETIRAMDCSVCPESILRRFAIDVEVSIREPFRNEYGGLKKQDTLRFDVYSLVLKRFKFIEQGLSGKQSIVWDVIPRSEWNSHEDEEHDFHAMCSFIAGDIAQHRRRQQSQSVIQKQLDDCGFCTLCHCPDMICACPSDLKAVAMMNISNYWQTMNTRELWDLRIALTNFTFFLSNTTKTSILWYKLYKDRRRYLSSLIVLILSGLLCTFLSAHVAQAISFASLGHMVVLYTRTVRQIDEEIARRQDRLSALCEDVSTHLENNARKYFAISGGVFFAYGLYKVIKPFLLERTQDKSTYLDTTVDYFAKVIDCPAAGEHVFDIQDQRDYKEGYSRMPPKDTRTSRTTTSGDLQRSLARALRVVVTKSKGKTYGTVNGIMVASNVIMIPAHAVPYTFPFDIETTSTPGVPSARTKDQKLTEEYCHIDRESDQAYIHLASSPASTDYSRFFPIEYPTFYNRSTVLLWKSPENEVKISRQAARPNHEAVKYAGFLEHPGWLWGQQHKLTILEIAKGKGLKYDTEFKGFGGLCGGLIVDANCGIIYGFHVAGIPNTFTGWSTCVLQSQIKEALATLRTTSPTMVVHSTDDVVVDTYGLPYTLVNEKPLYLREDGTKEKTIVTYLGTVLKDGQHLESRARPPYMKTPFKGVSENLGERKHRPPTRPNDVDKGMKTLNKLMDPVQHYEGDILRLAIADYKEHTLVAIRDDPDAASILRIYSQEEAMDGIGKFGLGGLPNDTSAGFPIQKSKKHCLKRDAMDESLVQIPREFNDNYNIQDEIDRTLDCWSKRLRSEAIYKASSKVNELLPNEKAVEKVRKFYGSSFSNFVASRRVLAGIPQIMKKHWKTTECLVGINPLSKEWDDFHDFLTEYSTTNMIAGDFSGYDTRMAAQITAAAAKIMVSWYEEVGCSEEDITLIEGALSDIVHPNILFDGNLFRFANGNPSGNLITVQLNSICNSIMMRYVYYAMMPNIKEKFATNVRLGTYGDDNALSVKGHCKWYTHTTCQEEFEKLDIGYTMADKGAKSRPYIGIDEISFLKRGFAHHEELDIVVAPIEQDSILKRFHWVKKPTETPLSFTEQFGAYTDGAIREQYLHGRVSYDAFIGKLRNIVALNEDLKGVINFVPYEEMTQILKPDYSPEYVNKNLKLFAESCGVVEDDLAADVYDGIEPSFATW
jgi:energy-coupling factor transporter ATP-binding protein EcfA2